MKTIYFALMLLISVFINAQVGVTSLNPLATAAMDVRASDKGASFTAAILPGKTDFTTVPASDELLKSSGWEYFFADLNTSEMLSKVKNYSSASKTAYTFTKTRNQFLGFTAHTNGEKLDTSQWTVISEITKNVEIDRPSNEMLMTINGMYQANNRAADAGGITSTIAFFVDDKLIDVKPMFLYLAEPCASRQFMIYGVANNLSAGNHTVKFAIRNIDAPAISGLTVSYGAPNPSPGCSPISEFKSGISSSIFIK